MAKFYEFFAGGGMARKGLGRHWTCLFANDFDFKKGLTYQANFGAGELKVADIRAITPGDLPGVADLMWGSLPNALWPVRSSRRSSTRRTPHPAT